MGLELAVLDCELSALSIWPLRQVLGSGLICAIFIFWIQILKPLLALAWSFFRKILFLFEIYMGNGNYRRIGKKWHDFLITLLNTKGQ